MNIIHTMQDLFKKPDTITKVKRIAKKTGWEELSYQPTERMISFSKAHGKTKDRLNFYYTTRTVGTVITHPIKGRTQLFRKDVTDEELERIFTNPRIHTNKGYMRK